MRQCGSLMGDEMGLGKAVQDIGVANMMGARRIMVGCHASLKMNWYAEIQKWQVMCLPVYVISSGVHMPKGIALPEGWWIVSWEIAQKYERELKTTAIWDLIILGEIHKLKTMTALRTKFFLGGEDKTSEGKTKIIPPIRSKKRLAMTGTPICNRPLELFSFLAWLQPAQFKNKADFKRRFCTNAGDLARLQDVLRASVMVRRLKSQVLKELPPKQRQVITLDVSEGDYGSRRVIEEELETYARFERALEDATYEKQKAQSEGNEEGYKIAVAKLKAAYGIQFTEMSRVRHATALAKVPYVIEHLKDIDAEKLVIFAHHLDVVDLIAQGVSDDKFARTNVRQMDGDRGNRKTSSNAAEVALPVPLRQGQNSFSANAHDGHINTMSGVSSNETRYGARQGVPIGEYGAIKSKKDWSAMHTGLAGHRRSGEMSVVGNSAEIQQQTDASKQSIVGQDRSEERLHEGERVGGQLAGEYDQTQRHASGTRNADRKSKRSNFDLGSVVIITGETPIEERQRLVNKFQEDPSCRYIIGNISAMGVGFTLTAASHVVFVELDWVPGNIFQAEDRLHRIGQFDSVLVQHLVFDGSLDGKMAKTLVAKQEVIDKALDRAGRPVDGDEEEDIVGVKRHEKPWQKDAPIRLTPTQILAVHGALRVLAGLDADGARTINGVGFNKIDTRFGRELAQEKWLTPRQADAGAKIVQKYRKQYPKELYMQIFGEAW